MILIPDFGYGGGQSLAVNVVKELSNCSAIDFLIVSLYPSQNTVLEKDAIRNNLKYVCLNKHPGYSFKTTLELRKVIKRFKPDVIHAHLRVMTVLLPCIVFRKKFRVLYTVHNLAAKDGRGFLKYVLSFAFKFCNVQPIAISDTCRQSITEYYRFPIDKIPCVYVGTDLHRFNRKNEYSMLNDEIIRFIAVGRLTKQKNYSLMINAFIEAHKHKTNIQLTIVGKGEEYNQLVNIVNMRNQQNVIKVVGYVSDLKSALENSHVYLMSSDWEGLPQSALEALSIGLPIVTTKAGGVVDIVKEGENGFLVECGDQEGLTKAILKISNSREQRNLFSKNNIRDSVKYSINKCAEDYEKIYLE